MSDGKFDFTRYQNIGGINEKSSDHTTGVAQFLNLVNLDFYTPNALTQMPGSTQAISGTSGRITGLYEYIQESGNSQILVGTETRLSVRSGSSLVPTGYSTAQNTNLFSFASMHNNAFFSNSDAPGVNRWDGTTFYSVPLEAPIINSDFGVTIHVGGPSLGASLGNFGSLVGNERFRVYYAFSYQNTIGLTGPIFQGFGFSSQLPSYAGSTAVGASYIDIFMAGDTQSVLARRGASSILIWRSIRPITGPNAVTAIPKFETVPFYYLDKVEPGTTFYRDTFGATTLIYNSQADWYSSNVSVISTAKYVEVFNNSMVYAGFPLRGAEDPTNRASEIVVSEIDDAERAEADFTYYIDRANGQIVRGIKAYESELVVFKDRSFYRFFGDSHDNYQVQLVTNLYGLINNQSAIKGPDALYFLDRQGIVRYDGANYGLISGPMEKTFERMNISAAINCAVAGNNLDRKQLWFSFPIDGATTNNVTVVYDYQANAWTKRDGPAISYMSFMKGELNRPNLWYGGYSGKAFYNGTSFYSHNGEAMTCSAFTRFENGSGFNHTDLWRRFFMDIEPTTGNTTPITVSFFQNYDEANSVTTRTFQHATFQQRADFGIPSKSIAAQMVSSSASLPLQVKSFSWAFRKLRDV